MIIFRSEGGFLDALMRHNGDAFDSQCMERAFYGQQSGVAHQMTVPASFGSMIKLQRVGGMGYTSNNLAHFTGGAFTLSYGNISAEAVDGIIYVRSAKFGGAASSPDQCYPYTSVELEAGTYTISFDFEGDLSSYLTTNSAFKIQNVTANQTIKGSLKFTGNPMHTFTLTEKSVVAVGLYIVDSQGSSFDFTMRVMLNKGTEVLPFEPAFEGIRSTPATAIESKGKNLFNINATPTWNTNTINTLTKIDDVTFTTTNSNASGGGNGIYIGTFDAGVTITISGYYKCSSANAVFMNIVTPKNGSGNLTKGMGTVSEYTSFFHTFTTVDSNKEYYYRPAYATNHTSGMSITLKNVQIELGGTATDYEPYLCDSVSIHPDIQALPCYGLGISEDCNNYIDFEKGQYVQMCDIDGEGNVYPLDNPIITDIARYLTAMTSLNVVSGGTLTFVNEYSQAVPFTVGYKIT